MVNERKPPLPNLIARSPSSPDYGNAADYLAGPNAAPVTIQQIESIININQKALQIYLEVSDQNEDILDSVKNIKDELRDFDKVSDNVKEARHSIEKTHEQVENSQAAIILRLESNNEKVMKALKDIQDTVEENAEKIADIDKALFRLYLFLGSSAVGIIVNIIQLYLTTKK